MGAVRVQTAKKKKHYTYPQVIHMIPVHPLTACKTNNCVFVINKFILNVFFFTSNCCFRPKYENNMQNANNDRLLFLGELISNNRHWEESSHIKFRKIWVLIANFWIWLHQLQHKFRCHQLVWNGLQQEVHNSELSSSYWLFKLTEKI